MPKTPPRATSLRLAARTHDYVALVARERDISRSAAYAAIADEHAARLDLSLASVTRGDDDGLTWELRVLPAVAPGAMLILATDGDGEVSTSALRDRCERRDGWSGRTTRLDDGRELSAAMTAVREIVARHHATKILDSMETTR